MHDAKKMRLVGGDVELLTVVHDEPALPEEPPQLATLPFWDERLESTGETLNIQMCECESSRKNLMLDHFAQTRLLEHFRWSVTLPRARVAVQNPF